MKLVKIFWQRLSRPSKAASGVLLGLGFVGGILFWGAFNTGMEATNTEAFCSSCHAPIVAEIRETIHWSPMLWELLVHLKNFTRGGVIWPTGNGNE